jgi:hypothetical protein
MSDARDIRRTSPLCWRAHRASRIESEARRAPQAEVINIHVALYSLLRI